MNTSAIHNTVSELKLGLDFLSFPNRSWRCTCACFFSVFFIDPVVCPSISAPPTRFVALLLESVRRHLDSSRH
jgi:hypothetical protein